MKLIILFLLLLSCDNSIVSVKPSEPKTSDSSQTSSVDVKTFDASCPLEMIHVSGPFCEEIEQTCLQYLDPEKSIIRRCASYSHNTKCLSKEELLLNFCIDKLEQAEIGNKLPWSDISWTNARTVCESKNKRLCTVDEWTYACEGPEYRPYPYGFERNSAICNIDKMNLLDPVGRFIDQRWEATDFTLCLSSFGVQNMVGNVDEWVADWHFQHPKRSFLKGGWWGPLRSRCRAMTGGHDEYFKEISIGFRCCKDASL